MCCKVFWNKYEILKVFWILHSNLTKVSLANKYRPQTFDKIIWQDHITDILKAQMKSDQKIHHNYLLFGPRGTGKTTAARILAKALNCLNSKDWNPCNECANCQVINKWTSLDYIEIDAASHTWVDNIREEILDKVPYPPTQLKKKIYVIDEVHMLSKWAFNALLKTIEEPRNNVCFILATTEIHKVPDTIISRCQVFNFKKVGEEDMAGHLKEICKKENLDFEAEALGIISKISEGCVRDAVKYIDQISILGDITQEHVSKFLWVASESIIRNFFRLIKDGNRKDIFDDIDRIYQSGIDLHQFAKQALIYIDHNLESDIDFLLKVSESFSEIISSIKYYPYPAIVYKIVFNKHLAWKIQDTSWKIQGEEENKWVVNESVVVDLIKVKSPKEEINNSDQDIDSIRNWVLEKIEKISLKQNLKWNFIIEWINWNIVEAIIINKMTKILLDNDENKRMLEDAFAAILWVQTKINIKFESKEDYFARKMF